MRDLKYLVGAGNMTDAMVVNTEHVILEFLNERSDLTKQIAFIDNSLKNVRDIFYRYQNADTSR